MSSSQSQIPVSKNSLYITTVPLIAERFHWSLIHVDETGKSTEHEWVPTTKNPNGPEAYRHHLLTHGTTNRHGSGSIPILAYFRVSDYTPIPVAEFTAICTQISPKSFTTAHQNRIHKISCRTWVLSVIARLISKEREAEVEKAVVQRSNTYTNEYATAFLYQKAYTTQVVSI